MWKAVTIWLLLSCSQALAWTHGSGITPPTPAVTCDITTGNCTGTGGGSSLFTAATCNGVADDSAMFTSFNSWAVGTWQASHSGYIKLDFKGLTCNITSNTVNCPTGGGLSCQFLGIKQLMVEGSGGRFTGNHVLSLAGQGLYVDNTHSVRLSSASPGDSCVTATAAAAGGTPNVTIFTVGQYAVITGLDVQGLWNNPFGFPPNPQFHEYRKVTSANNTSKVVCFDTPLTGTYLSTWPLYNNGSASQVDAGGPATLYVLDASWDTDVYYHNITIDFPGQDIANTGLNASGRNVIFDGVTTTFARCIIPSQNGTWSVYNSNLSSCTLTEPDKIVDTVTIVGTTIAGITWQSGSINSLVMRNSAITSFMNGTAAKSNQISDTSFAAFKPGVTTYGATTGTTVCTRCAVATFNFQGGNFLNDGLESMSGGIISWLNTDESGPNPPGSIFVPNSNIYFAATGFSSTGLFQAQTVTQDPTHVFVQTNQAGGFPTIATPTQFRTHPAPQFTCDACTGDPTLVATNIQAGATALAPLASYSQRSFSPASANTGLGNLVVTGNLVSLDVNVTQAYTGTGSAVLNPTGLFHNFTVDQSAQATFDWWPTINLKQAGERVITPTGVTCNGVSAPTGCSGDSLGTALPNAVWVQNGLSPSMPSTLSGGVNPVFTITIKTDQHVVP